MNLANFSELEKNYVNVLDSPVAKQAMKNVRALSDFQG